MWFFSRGKPKTPKIAPGAPVAVTDPIQQILQALSARSADAGISPPIREVVAAAEIAASHLLKAEEQYTEQIQAQIRDLGSELEKLGKQFLAVDLDRHNASRAVPQVDHLSPIPYLDKYRQLEAEVDRYRSIADQALKDPDTSWDVYEAASNKWSDLSDKKDKAYAALQDAENRVEEAVRRKEFSKENIERRFVERSAPIEAKRAELRTRFDTLVSTRNLRTKGGFDPLLTSTLADVFFVFWQYCHSRVPISAAYGKSSCPVRDAIGTDAVDFLRRLLAPITKSHDDPLQIFSPLVDQIRENEARIQRQLRGANWYDPFSGLSPAEIVDGLFAGTPLKALFDAELPVAEPDVPEIDEKHWYSHALLLAQTRFGKTNVIQWRLSELLPQIAEGKASAILMEPKGVLTDSILHLASIWGMRERVVIIDPMDTKVSVNVFDKGDGSDYAINETIARVSRVLDTVTTSLTPFQQDTLTFCLRAMFCVNEPGSMRLLTRILRRGLQDFQVHNLPPTVQEFFEFDFKPGDGSAQQVISRLNRLLSNPIFEALFNAQHSTFDMSAELQQGKLIIINVSAANEMYARFWIEQVASCVQPRFKILPADKRVPTTFVIDEAQTWIKDDLHFAGILDKAAEARIGMLIAAHHMGQITDVGVRGSIYTNTTLKFSARSTEDIYALCRSMGNIKPDVLEKLPQYQFAYFGPNMDQATIVKFPLVEFDKMPRMTDAQYAEFRAHNRTKYGYNASSPEPAALPAPALAIAAATNIPALPTPAQQPPTPVINHDPTAPSKESY